MIMHFLADMLSFQKKNAGQRATTSFHSSILRARRVIFEAMHKEKLKFKVMLRVTVLNSVNRKTNLFKKNGGYFRLTPSNDLNTVPPLIAREQSCYSLFFSSFFFSLLFIYRPIIRFTMTV